MAEESGGGAQGAVCLSLWYWAHLKQMPRPLFCRCQHFTLVWMYPGPSTDAETAVGLPSTHRAPENAEQEDGLCGEAGRLGVPEMWGNSQNLGGPIRSWDRGARVS